MKTVCMRTGWAVLLAVGMLPGMGCFDSGKDSGEDEPAPGEPRADGGRNGEEQTLSAFQRILPSGLAMGPKSWNRYPVRCDAIDGAVRYHFTTSFGASISSATPEAVFVRPPADDPFTLSVFATNAAGEHTRTASRLVNTSNVVDASGRDPLGPSIVLKACPL